MMRILFVFGFDWQVRLAMFNAISLASVAVYLQLQIRISSMGLFAFKIDKNK
jgi:hypothetical protein